MSVVESSEGGLRTLPLVRQLLHLKSAHGKEIGHFVGQFETAQDALNSVPASKRSSWDDDDLVENGIGTFSTVHSFDWPLLFFLGQFTADKSLKTVTDFGGHIGVKYLGYRDVIKFPADLIWQVVETPAVVRAGRKRSTPELAALHFFEDVAEAAPCDILICSGSIQYTGQTVAQLVNRLPQKPRMILLNKMPVSKERGYYTIERFLKSLAYRIYGPQELELDRTELGYALTAHWDIPHRDFLVYHHRRLELVPMIGEAWTLTE